MAILKSKEISKMNDGDIEDRLRDLKMELLKEKVNLGKGGKMKINEIKRTIARLLTFDRINKKVSVETK